MSAHGPAAFLSLSPCTEKRRPNGRCDVHGRSSSGILSHSICCPSLIYISVYVTVVLNLGWVWYRWNRDVFEMSICKAYLNLDIDSRRILRLIWLLVPVYLVAGVLPAYCPWGAWPEARSDMLLWHGHPKSKLPKSSASRRQETKLKIEKWFSPHQFADAMEAFFQFNKDRVLLAMFAVELRIFLSPELLPEAATRTSLCGDLHYSLFLGARPGRAYPDSSGLW